MAAEVEKNPERTELRKELGLIEYRAKRFDKAIADLSSLLEKYKDSPKVQADLYAGIGECYQGKGDFPPAIENLKKATQLAPDSAPYFNVLASIYDAAGKTKEALTAYKAALKLDPQNALMMNNAAYLMAKSGGDLDEALRMVQVARRQLPDVAEILDTLGWIYLKKDLVSSACQVFQDLIEKAGNNPTYRYHYALALAKKGDKKAALEQLDLALKNQPAKAEEEQIRVLMKTLS
jgi:tetratricopeptide (TPR) repeat protein